MNRTIFAILFLGLFSCSNKCENCKLYKSKTTKYSFSIDEDFWKVYDNIFAKKSEFHLTHSLSSLQLDIYASKNKYLETSPFTNLVEITKDNSEDINLGKYTFKSISYITEETPDNKIQYNYYERIEPNESLAYLIYYKQNDRIAQNQNLNELLKNILVLN